MGYFRKQPEAPENGVAPATSVAHAPDASGIIGHDPGLIEALHADHAQLGTMYTQIGTAGQAGNGDAVHALLAEFKTLLQKHILIENVYFYAYLKQSMVDDAYSIDTIHEFRRDMNAIARQAFAFIATWQASDLDSLTERKAFAIDFDSVGVALEQRFDCEEVSLFPLYKPG